MSPESYRGLSKRVHRLDMMVKWDHKKWFKCNSKWSKIKEIKMEHVAQKGGGGALASAGRGRACIDVSIYLSIYLFTNLSIFLSFFLPIYLPNYLSIYLSIYMDIYIYICIYIYVCIYMYINIYIYIHIHIYTIYTYTYIYI